MSPKLKDEILVISMSYNISLKFYTLFVNRKCDKRPFDEKCCGYYPDIDVTLIGAQYKWLDLKLDTPKIAEENWYFAGNWRLEEASSSTQQFDNFEGILLKVFVVIKGRSLSFRRQSERTKKKLAYHWRHNCLLTEQHEYCLHWIPIYSNCFV